MPLTKAQIIEIQETAKFNYHKRVREMEDKKRLAELVAEKVSEKTEVKPVVQKSVKKESK